VPPRLHHLRRLKADLVAAVDADLASPARRALRFLSRLWALGGRRLPVDLGRSLRPRLGCSRLACWLRALSAPTHHDMRIPPFRNEDARTRPGRTGGGCGGLGRLGRAAGALGALLHPAARTAVSGGGSDTSAVSTPPGLGVGGRRGRDLGLGVRGRVGRAWRPEADARGVTPLRGRAIRRRGPSTARSAPP